MKYIKTADFPDNSYVERVDVADDGSVAITYRGKFMAVLKTAGTESEPMQLGPSLRVKLLSS